MSTHVCSQYTSLHTLLENDLLFLSEAGKEPHLLYYFVTFCEVKLFLDSFFAMLREARRLLSYMIFIIKTIVGIIMT